MQNTIKKIIADNIESNTTFDIDSVISSLLNDYNDIYEETMESTKFDSKERYHSFIGRIIDDLDGNLVEKVSGNVWLKI